MIPTWAYRLAANAISAFLDRMERARGIHDDDLMAVADATRETYPTITREPTPLGDEALAAAVARQCAIEAAVEDWAAEVAACADAELADMTKGDHA